MVLSRNTNGSGETLPERPASAHAAAVGPVMSPEPAGPWSRPNAVESLPWLGGATVTVIVAGEDTGGSLGVVRIEAPPGYVAGAHIHTNEEETFLVLDGTVEVRAGAMVAEVPAGGVARLPRGVSHSYATPGGARFLNICTPGGLEEFFSRASELIGGGAFELSDVQAMAEGFGVHYL